jgi:fructokinase
MIVSCGEALIDFVPATTNDGRRAYVPCVGGSPFNIAVAVARLGAPAGFLGGVSTDFFGDDLARALAASGVDTRYVLRLERPSTLAFVSLGAGEPEYIFFDAEAAHRYWEPALPLGTDVTMLHFGSISLLGQPAADRFARLMEENKGQRIVCLDPNIRPSVIVDETSYRERLRAMLALADVIKISAADLDWLVPGADPNDVARGWIEHGTALVVVTLGADGALAHSAHGDIRYPGTSVAVVDTVGAGDSFMGALLAGLAKLGVASVAQLRAQGSDAVEAAVAYATRASAITCSRRGADPPWSRELAFTRDREQRVR